MLRPGRLALALAPVGAVLALASPIASAGPAPSKLLKGPYLTGLSDTGADVRFELDAPGPATVEVTATSAGPDASAPRRFPDANVTANHLVHVTGLEASKTYAYTVSLGGPVIGRGSITTGPDPMSGAPLTFAVYGDCRSDPATHDALVHAIMAVPGDFVVNTGDVVADGGNASDWQSFFAAEEPLIRDRPLLLGIGNHELYDDESGANFARYFGFPDATGALKPYGTTRIGDARFFFLNGMHDWTSGEERAWLDRELTKADTEPGLVWRIAVVHHSPWSAGPHGPNAKLVAGHVPELLAAHKVDLLLAGHDHIYERGDGNGVKYIISGGSGAPLYKITKPMAQTRKAEASYHFVEVTLSGNQLKSVAHRLDGSVLETCGFTKGKSWDCDPPPPAPASPTPSPTSGGAQPSSSSWRCAVASPGAARGGVAFVGLAAVAVGAMVRRRRSQENG
jgi:MYXO-CTERM domain-containing protein